MLCTGIETKDVGPSLTACSCCFFGDFGFWFVCLVLAVVVTYCSCLVCSFVMSHPCAAQGLVFLLCVLFSGFVFFFRFLLFFLSIFAAFVLRHYPVSVFLRWSGKNINEKRNKCKQDVLIEESALPVRVDYDGSIMMVVIFLYNHEKCSAN